MTQRQIAELRTFSTRARITSTSFVNTYEWGNFRGDPSFMMEKYFDAFVYTANWGTRELMMRIPKNLLNIKAATDYCDGRRMTMRTKGEYVIFCFLADDEEREWEGWMESEGWMASLIPLRSDLAAGDLRGLYLGWLAGIRDLALEEDRPEPPVPPGLKELTAPLKALADFFGIDDAVMETAAENSEKMGPTDSARSEWKAWIHSLPQTEKDEFLLSVMEGKGRHLQRELFHRFIEKNPQEEHGSQENRRTVSHLISTAGFINCALATQRKSTSSCD